MLFTKKRNCHKCVAISTELESNDLLFFFFFFSKKTYFFHKCAKTTLLTMLVYRCAPARRNTMRRKHFENMYRFSLQTDEFYLLFMCVRSNCIGIYYLQ